MLLEDGVRDVLVLDGGFLGAEGLGLGAGAAVVRGCGGTWGFSTSFMSCVSAVSADEQTSRGQTGRATFERPDRETIWRRTPL